MAGEKKEAKRPTLRAPQARAIIAAEAAYADAKRALEQARKDRDAVRERYRERLPLGEPVKVAGWVIKRVTKRSGQRFRLGAYLERHKLTAAMRPFVTPNTEYEDWRVEPAAMRAVRSGRAARSL